MRSVIRRHGAYVAFATTSLALAVGATLTVFTIVNALWLRPLPFPDANRLVTLTVETTGSDEPLAFIDLEAPGSRWTAFETVVGQVVAGGLSGLAPRVVFDRIGYEVETIGVTSRYFQLLGQPIRGRDFAEPDNRHGAEPVAIISDRLWTRIFQRRPDVIGGLAPAKPFPFRIIGIAAPGFEGARRGEHADLWIPSSIVPRVSPGATAKDSVPMLVLARLHPGQTPFEAERRLDQSLPNGKERSDKERIRVVPLADVYGTPDSRTTVIREQGAAAVVAALAGLVLLAGCVTLMALVLVHYERRRRELAIRIALGASRSRLALELSGELLWVAAAGTAAAMFITLWALRTLPALSLPGGVDLARLNLSFDWRVLAMGVGTTVMTLAGAALIPVSRFTSASLACELTSAGSTTSASSQRLRQTLLGVHVSATIVVLVAAGLFVRAVIYGFTAGPGYDVDRTVYVGLRLPFWRVDEDFPVHLARTAQVTGRIADGLRSLPGVEEVALGPSPIGPDQASYALTPKTVDAGGERATPRELQLGTLSGSPELLRALGIPIIKGRALSAADATASPIPVVITASLARTLWPADEPLGHMLSLDARSGRYTVVGIAADFVCGSLTQTSAGALVSVMPGGYGIEPHFVVRTPTPEMLIEPIRKRVRDVAPDAARVVVSTGREIVAHDLGQQRLGAWFFSGFGVVALFLGAGGVFGLVAYLAESRRREFGVRLALGASAGDLVRRGVATGLAPVSIGAAVGLGGSALVARIFISVLPGLSALDPLTYASVAMLMMGCAAVAGLAAAWRLRDIAPGDALRGE